MRNLLFALLLSSPLIALGGEPYNVNEYQWESNVPYLSGGGKETSLNHVWDRVQESIDAYASRPKSLLRDRQEIEVTVTWRGNRFKRIVLVHLRHDPVAPKDIPRGGKIPNQLLR